MASEGMVQELDRLRKLLDVTPADSLRKYNSGGMSGSESAYAGALSAAEVLSPAIYKPSFVTGTLQ